MPELSIKSDNPETVGVRTKERMYNYETERDTLYQNEAITTADKPRKNREIYEYV